MGFFFLVDIIGKCHQLQSEHRMEFLRSYSLTDFGMPSAPETNGFQTDRYFCKNGLRLQVFFPMCWDNKTLDSSDHRSHMAYPTRYNGGNCPASHPVRLPGVFFEAFYAVDKFPHGQGTQPFVLSNGDPTGYGFHGDFVSWYSIEFCREDHFLGQWMGYRNSSSSLD